MLSQNSRSILTTAILCIFALLAFSFAARADDHQVRSNARGKILEAKKEADKGKYEKAVKLLEQALAMVQQMDDSQSRRIKEVATTGLVDMYEKLGNFDQARKLRSSLPTEHTSSSGSDASADGVVSRSVSPSCNPNWSPKFSQVTLPGFDSSPASIRQTIEQSITKYGGVDGAIEQAKSELGTNQGQLEQQQNDGNAEGVNLVQQMILIDEAALEVLRCRQQISTQTNSVSAGSPTGSAPSGSAQSTSSPQVPAQIDVRYIQVDSRPLTDVEMTEVRNSLRWEPDSVPLAPGGAARSNLVDGKGGRLGSVLVRWEKPPAPKAGHPGQSRGYFTLQIENGSSCVFLSSAEIDDSQGFMVVSGVTWSGWLTLHQPDRGQTSQIKGDAALPQAYPSLVLKPLTAYSTLSACMTPKNP